MSSTVMLSEMSGGGQGGQTVVAAEEQQIKLDFFWGKSCFKGKYPRWRQVKVSQLLALNGLTDEMLEHELKVKYIFHPQFVYIFFKKTQKKIVNKRSS